jgi:hypothetical protein
MLLLIVPYWGLAVYASLHGLWLIAILCFLAPSRALGVWAAIGAGIGFLLVGEYVAGGITFAVVLLNAAVFLIGRQRDWFR